MDIIKQLQQIGFSEYEAKTYLALLRENPATGYQISKISGVPRSMVYEVLSRLHLKGMVFETIEERATYYRPLPPNVLLEQFKSQTENIIAELSTPLIRFFEDHKDNRVWSILDQNSILSYCDQMFNNAKNEVYLVANDYSLAFLEKPLGELAKKNIILNLLLTGSKKFKFGNVAYHPPLESEIQGLTDTLLILIDNQELLVGSIAKEARATITSNANLILIAKQFVWMEFFTQRIYSQIGDDLLERLDPKDREIFQSMVH